MARKVEVPEVTRWQRLAPVALLFVFIGGALRFVRENLFAFAGAGAGVAFIEQLGLREALLGLLAVALAGLVAAMIYHRRFRFRLEDDAIRVRKGLFKISDLRIRFARVQHISITQPLYFKPFGLVRFNLETPGAAQSEVELPGIDTGLAERLRDAIAQADASDDHGDEGARSTEAGDPGLLYAPSRRRLFLHGLVSNQVWVLAGVAAYAWSQLRERIDEWMEQTGISEVVAHLVNMSVIFMAIVVVAILILLLILSGIIAVVRFDRYQLREAGDRVVARYGLFSRQEQTLRLEKLTGLTATQTAGGRLLGLWTLIGQQATGIQVEGNQRSGRFLVPGVSNADRSLTGILTRGRAWPEEFHPISRRFRRLFWTRIGAVLTVVLSAVFLFAPLPVWTIPFGVIGLGVVIYLIHRRWQSWGWQVVDDCCWVRQGLFGRRIDTFEMAMVQQVQIVRSPYLTRHGLATVVLILPHGEISVPFLIEEQAAELANRALFAAETALAHRI